jgi:hypothetical protein
MSLEIALFSGSRHFSKLIQYCQKRQLMDHVSSAKGYQCALFSHVGILVNSHIVPGERNLVPGYVYIFESAGADTKDVRGKHVIGVQLRDFRKILEHCIEINEKVAIVSLKATQNLTPDQINDMIGERSDKFILSTLGIPYPLNVMKMVAAFNSKVRKVMNDMNQIHILPKTYFCSQLVADFLKFLGVLPDSVDPSSVLPMDFCGCDVDKNDGISNICDFSTFKFLSAPSAVSDLQLIRYLNKERQKCHPKSPNQSINNNPQPTQSENEEIQMKN